MLEHSAPNVLGTTDERAASGFPIVVAAFAYRGEENRPLTIVGIVADSKYNDLHESEIEPMMWTPLAPESSALPKDVFPRGGWFPVRPPTEQFSNGRQGC